MNINRAMQYLNSIQSADKWDLQHVLQVLAEDNPKLNASGYDTSKWVRLEPQKQIPWRPADGETYYWIDAYGYPVEAGVYKDFNHIINQSNCYPTREIAEHEAKYLAAYRKLRNIARELRGNWVPDSHVWRLLDDVTGLRTTQTSIAFCIGPPLFETQEKAQQALDLLTQKERETLARG